MELDNQERDRVNKNDTVRPTRLMKNTSINVALAIWIIFTVLQ